MDVETTPLTIIPWGWAKGRWANFIVGRECGKGHDAVCKHVFRTDAEKCIAQRNAGSPHCIDFVAPVPPERKRDLAELSVLASSATRQDREVERLRLTLQQIKAIADGILVSLEDR